jgi:hypothetical protein
MKTLARTLMAAAFAFSAAAANAEPLSVEYLVHRKPLIAALNGGDTLTFQFYSDAKCEALAGKSQIAASNPLVHFERVKGQRIKHLKGADYLRIAAVIEDAPSGANFLRVEGAGVNPAKEICQPQAVAGGGLTGLRFVDTSVTDELLGIAGVQSVEELRSALEQGQVPTSVVCELLAEVLSQGGTEIPVGVCDDGGGAGDPLALLGGLLDLNN